MPQLFPTSNDDLLGTLPASFGPLAATLRELVALLAVDSYDDMGKASSAQRQQLLELEEELSAQLTPSLHPATTENTSTSQTNTILHAAPRARSAKHGAPTSPPHTTNKRSVIPKNTWARSLPRL